MNEKNWRYNVVVFIMWLLVSALGFWVMIVLRQALLGSLAALYVGESMRRAWRVRFVGQAYFVIAGLLYLIYLFAIEGYLKDGGPPRFLLQRFARVSGIGLLLLFVGDFVTSLVQDSPLARYSLLLLLVELVAGAALLAYSIWRSPRRRRQRDNPSLPT